MMNESNLNHASWVCLEKHLSPLTKPEKQELSGRVNSKAQPTLLFYLIKEF
jgi:hypothetical protein